MKTLKLSVFFTLFVSISAHGQVITDGSMGDIKHLSAHITIPQNLGTTQGNNLFHSFKTFNINSNESVTFTGADNLKNVISRVTGGELSHIYGSLTSEIKNANFYLINPAGIFFGNGAKVDVPAAFHISTSDSLNFKDGRHFLASLNQTSSNLSITEPESFGFLKTSHDNNALIEINNAELSFKTKQTVDLVASNISINNDSKIIAPSGEIRLITAQGSASVSLLKDSKGNLPLPTITPSIINSGRITLENKLDSIDNVANLNTTGDGGGHIAIWGGKTLFKDSNVYADNTGNSDATISKGITINTYSLNLDNSNISFDALNSGHANNIVVNINTTDFLNMFNKSVIKADTNTNANAGNIEVTANTLMINDNNSGLQNPTGIYSQAKITKDTQDNTVVGNAGNVTVNAKTIDMLNGGVIFTTTSTNGNAGNVIVGNHNNLNRLTIDASSYHTKTGIFSDINANGNISNHAGNVAVNAYNLNILNGGSISASTYSLGSAGDINIQANNIDIQSFNHGEQDINDGILAQSNYNFDNYGALGDVGNITIMANQTIHLHNAGNISTKNQTNGENNNMAHLFGNITINASDIKLDSGGLINTQSTDMANAGFINLSFLHTLTVDNAIITTQASNGNGGNINIDKGKVINLSNQGKINTYTINGIKGGNISGHADILFINNATIQTKADNANNGGDITLNLKAIIASQNQLQTNGVPINNSDFDEDVTNIIKTAHSGVLSLNAPQLNLSGSLGELKYDDIHVPDLTKGSCDDIHFIKSALSKRGKDNMPTTENRFVFIPPIIKKHN